MISKLLPLLISIVFVASTSLAAPQRRDVINLSIPDTVLAEAVRAAVPIAFDAKSKSISGDITIVDITDLNVTDRFLSCKLRLSGQNLAFLTEVAGHDIKLKVGAVDIAFHVDAQLRFDQRRQILYIRPVIRDVNGSINEQGQPDIGQAIVAMLNGREFPIEIQKLDPIIARTGAKTVTINMLVADIKARPHQLELAVIPRIGSAATQSRPRKMSSN